MRQLLRAVDHISLPYSARHCAPQLIQQGQRKLRWSNDQGREVEHASKKPS